VFLLGEILLGIEEVGKEEGEHHENMRAGWMRCLSREKLVLKKLERERWEKSSTCAPCPLTISISHLLSNPRPSAQLA